MISQRSRMAVVAALLALIACFGHLDAQEEYLDISPQVIVSGGDDPFGVPVAGDDPFGPVEAIQATPAAGPPSDGAGRPSPSQGSGPETDKGPADKPGGESKGGEKQPDGSSKGGEEKPGENKPENSEGPVVRPSEPPKPPDPKELEIRPDAEGKVHFNFTGQSWPGVLQWLADVSGLSLDWQELPGGYLNLVTQRGYTLAEARDLINRHLLARGFTMLLQDEVLSVVKIENINPGMVPRVEPNELADRMPFEFVKTSFALDWLLAPKRPKNSSRCSAPTAS